MLIPRQRPDDEHVAFPRDTVNTEGFLSDADPLTDLEIASVGNGQQLRFQWCIPISVLARLPRDLIFGLELWLSREAS